MLFIIYVGDLFTAFFGTKGRFSSNTCIKIANKSYWVARGLYINEILFIQLIGLC